MNVFEIILLSVTPLILIYLIVMLLLRKKAINGMKKIGLRNIILVSPNANFFGQTSIGHKQMRGNGTLILTKEKLYFEMLLPKKIIEISLDKIERIEEGRSHLGKSKVSILMKIVYKNESNDLDSCAWLVRNREEWMEQIEKQVKERKNKDYLTY